jgi:hypothetical protein
MPTCCRKQINKGSLKIVSYEFSHNYQTFLQSNQAEKRERQAEEGYSRLRGYGWTVRMWSM